MDMLINLYTSGYLRFCTIDLNVNTLPKFSSSIAAKMEIWMWFCKGTKRNLKLIFSDCTAFSMVNT